MGHPSQRSGLSGPLHLSGPLRVKNRWRCKDEQSPPNKHTQKKNALREPQMKSLRAGGWTRVQWGQVRPEHTQQGSTHEIDPSLTKCGKTCSNLKVRAPTGAKATHALLILTCVLCRCPASVHRAPPPRHSYRVLATRLCTTTRLVTATRSTAQCPRTSALCTCPCCRSHETALLTARSWAPPRPAGSHVKEREGAGA